MEVKWWSGQGVVELAVSGPINNRDEAFAMTSSLVASIEELIYPHVIVILDLTALGNSPSAGVLLGGSLPPTDKIEHLILIKAPLMMRLAAKTFVHLRNKLHFVDSYAAARAKTNELLPRIR